MADPAAPAKPAAGNGNASTAKPAAEPKARTYNVFRADKADLKPGDNVVFLGEFKAEDKASARWAAVDADADLAKAVQVPKGQTDGGVHLIAVTSSTSAPERTAEEIEERKVRI